MSIPLPHEIREKYPLVTEQEIYEAVEIATIRAMQKIHSESVGAIYGTEGLDVFLYSQSQFSRIDLNKLRRRNKRRLFDELEIELMRRQACFEAKKYSSIRGSVFTGTIERISKNGTLTVMLQFNHVIQPITIYAECPITQQPAPERGLYRIGDSYDCMVISCNPVSNGKRAMVRTIVSRVARELPSRMISDLTGLTGIRCTKRIPGGYSKIITKYPIPKEAVIKVGKNLKEHLDVLCPTQPKSPFIFTRGKV